jgi:hypothetical protein
LYPHDAELDTRERWAEVSAEVAKEMQEKTDTSRTLPDHLVAPDASEHEGGEASAIASLPISGSA